MELCKVTSVKQPPAIPHRILWHWRTQRRSKTTNFKIIANKLNTFIRQYNFYFTFKFNNRPTRCDYIQLVTLL